MSPQDHRRIYHSCKGLVLIERVRWLAPVSLPSMLLLEDNRDDSHSYYYYYYYCLSVCLIAAFAIEEVEKFVTSGIFSTGTS
mmetsp:Transcript_52686/g.57177  ORF Transcript_52686/g.57177 Transcript_52686/m.57177 type:complete len:82 (+) Transcript_52686:231-476(+)